MSRQEAAALLDGQRDQEVQPDEMAKRASRGHRPAAQDWWMSRVAAGHRRRPSSSSVPLGPERERGRARDRERRAQADRRRRRRAELDVAIDGADNAAVPELPAIDGLSRALRRPSTQVSFVNGQVSRSVTHRFSVSASRPGAFTIGPVAVVVAGKRYEPRRSR
jgi:hypothetical protein